MVQKKNRRLCPERRINDDDFDFGDNNKLEQLRKDYRNNIASLRRTIDPSNGGNYVTEITPRSLTARKTESLSVNRNLIELETLVSRVGDNRHSSPAIMNDSIISSRDCQPYLLNSNLVSLDCSDDAVDSSFGACWGTSNSTRKTPYIRRSNETAVESTEAFVLNVLNFCDGI